jgi:hypothetical protein
MVVIASVSRKASGLEELEPGVGLGSADEAVSVLSAMWPGVESEGAPTEMGMRLSADQVAHEVDMPDELYQSARPDLSGYRVRVYEHGSALVPAPKNDDASEAAI